MHVHTNIIRVAVGSTIMCWTLAIQDPMSPFAGAIALVSILLTLAQVVVLVRAPVSSMDAIGLSAHGMVCGWIAAGLVVAASVQIESGWVGWIPFLFNLASSISILGFMSLPFIALDSVLLLLVISSIAGWRWYQRPSD